MLDSRHRLRFSFCSVFIVLCFLFCLPVTGAQANSQAINKTKQDESGEREIVETACVMIERGDFDEAGRFLNASARSSWHLVSQLKELIEQWQNLQIRRENQREESYKEQLAQFEKLKASNKLPGLNVDEMLEFAQVWLSEAEAEDEPNETNGVTAILAAVTRTIEFANDEQKNSLLSDPCLVGAIEKAKIEAYQFEKEGKWLDAYIKDYSWLSALDPNNKVYKDYAEQLLDKAEIAASFQDSPCETGRQRFDGVKRRIFERAVDALNFNYINKIDYRLMATKGVRQCRLLSEVIGTLTNTGQNDANASSLGDSFKAFKPDVKAIAEFSSSLNALEQETVSWADEGSKDKFLNAFARTLEFNLTSAGLPEEVLIAHFAEASFAALDPYTVIVWPTQVQDFEKLMTNEFSGVGIEITKEKGQLTVASLLPDTPAYNSGLDAGDIIENIDDVATKDMPIGCAVKYITGPSGTKVTLTIRHESQTETEDITITRAKITVPSIRGWQRNGQGKWQYMIDENEKIGYVRLTSFSENTASDLEAALDNLEQAGMQGFILDLRFNSGGFFDSAVDVSDEFLSEGLIVITRPRFGVPSYTAAHKNGTHPDYPMVVLVNSGSASASEIVAGALADPSQKRATLVGERTHGKGVVQGITHYPGEGAQLKYTMAYYHLPSGQRVKSRDETEKEGTKDWGIGPDVNVELRSDELRGMFDIQRNNDVLVREGHDITSGSLKKHTLEETINVDPQLSTAILVMKSKLIREKARLALNKAA